MAISDLVRSDLMWSDLMRIGDFMRCENSTIYK